MKEMGKLTISRPTSNFNKDGWIRIELRDIHYKSVFLVELELKEFAQAVTGLGSITCEYITYTKKDD